MRNKFFFLLSAAVVATLATGCANVERKLGRGFSNTFEVVRLGEMRRSVEQTSLFDSPEAGSTTGLVRGFNRTLARTGVGIYEIATAPFPPYGPVFTSYLSPGPVYPDSYAPGIRESSTFATDSSVGFSGGNVMPFLPGNRFRVFESP
jgi:putative exosortase-associated protein (TIGR04073 family)